MQNIIQCCKNHSSVMKIKENLKKLVPFEFPKPTVEDISLIIKSLNPRKAIGLDCIPLKVTKFASNVIDAHLCNIIIKELEKKQVLRRAKNSITKTHFQKKKKNKIESHRAVSILNGISKIYGRFIHNSLSSYAEKILSNFVSSCRKSYSSNRVFLRLIENWQKSPDNTDFVGTVLTVLIQKSFDCIPHDLLVAKIHAYGLSQYAVTLVYSYLEGRKQDVKINDTESVFQVFYLIGCITKFCIRPHFIQCLHK